MANRASERDHDRDIIDQAIAELIKLIQEGEVLRGCSALVPLLERRAKLLGLDMAPEADAYDGETVVERMTRQLKEQGRS